jgi:hypothetical protein
MQSAQAAEKAKQDTMNQEWKLKTDYMLAEKQQEYKIKALELQVKYGISKDQLASAEKIKAADITGIPPSPDNQPVPASPPPVDMGAPQPPVQPVQPDEPEPVDNGAEEGVEQGEMLMQ